MYTRGVMPDLKHRFRTHDLGFLKIVAELWGVDLSAPDARSALPKLTNSLLDPALVLEIVGSLPNDAREALDALIRNEGWMAWPRFTLKFGKLREMGPGRRDREKPYLDPVSPTEVLWYRGLIGQDFLMREGELQECAYIPDDLLALLPPPLPIGPEPPGRAASPGEKAHVWRTNDWVLDHTCTLLAALRMEDPRRSPAVEDWQPPYEVIYALLSAMKLITSSEQPVPEDARPFLEMPRGDALNWLVRGWRESELFNELKLIPGLICEGAWHNDPKAARDFILDTLGEIPEGKWWNLASFVKAIYEREPDFQRPAGDFDTWLIRDAETGDSLVGFKHWEAVDGALIRYMITGPMHWLGLIDLASSSADDPARAFRFSKEAEDLLLGKPISDAPVEDKPIKAFSDGTITADSLTPRIARYQVSRFCLWVYENKETYTYKLTPKSLRMGAEQGLKPVHLETLLKKFGEAPPPSLIKALHQWDQKGGQVKIHPAVILQVEDPKILGALRESSAGRFISDPLGPSAAIIKPGAAEKVASALARLGYLSDVDFSVAGSFQSSDADEGES
jgi:hypothetical protein